MSPEEKLEQMRTMKDEEALAASLSNPSVFEIIVERYQAAFLRKTQGIIGFSPEAEDVVSETFAKIYLRASKFSSRGNGSFKSWGYKVLVNTALSYYRRLKRERERMFPLNEREVELLADESGDDEQNSVKEYVILVLSRLPRHFSRVLEQYFLEGKRLREIAKIERLSLSAVKTRIHRAKREFRRLSSDIPFFW